MTYSKQINRLAPGVFEVITSNTVTSRDGTTGTQEVARLNLDFNPIVNALSEREKSYSYRLIHWQAQPKGDREWGIYDPQADSYVCSVFVDHPTAYGATKLIQLDDESAVTIPSAVIYFVGSLPVYNDANLTNLIETNNNDLL